MDLTKLSDADLAALAAGDLSKVSDEALTHLATAPAESKPKQKASATDVPNAIGTGFNQGLLRLAGTAETAPRQARHRRRNAARGRAIRHFPWKPPWGSTRKSIVKYIRKY